MQQGTKEPQLRKEPARPPTVRENVEDELTQLRAHLSRMAEHARIKSRGASTQILENLEVLESDMKRFASQVESATEESRSDVAELGETLKQRFQRLLDQIAVRGK